MARRWKILILVGIAVTLLDQWSKFLAVKHLTPGIERAHASSAEVASLSPEEKKQAFDSLGFFDELKYFYGSVKNPCVGRPTSCPTIAVVDGFWNWRYVENPGAAWGLLATARDSLRIPFFILVPIAAIAFIIYIFRSLPDSQILFITSLSLVFGGAIGNFIDRLHLTYVIDFIDWYVGKSHWPTFNVADSAITAGVALLVIQWFRDWASSRASNGSQSSAESTSAP